jgi:hypothetical protein
MPPGRRRNGHGYIKSKYDLPHIIGLAGVRLQQFPQRPLRKQQQRQWQRQKTESGTKFRQRRMEGGFGDLQK